MENKSKAQDLEEYITKVGKYLEFYSFQANREALLVILSDLYDSGFKTGQETPVVKEEVLT